MDSLSSNVTKPRIMGRDNSECGGIGKCYESFYHHKHCALCSKVYRAQSDGYGNIEGFGENAEAVECDECERYSCPECIRLRKDKKLCYDCVVAPWFKVSA